MSLLVYISGPISAPDMTPVELIRELRAAFMVALTKDSKTTDRRRKEFNQAIFDAEDGFANFNGTDLDMVMDKFDKAAANLLRGAK